MTRCIPSSALAPSAGLLECPERPSSRIASIKMPLCIRTGFKPVGSPITACRPSGRPAAASARAPLMLLSSSAVARTTSGCRRSRAANSRAASIASAKKDFMSAEPSP